jgi:hypothetical protein
MTHFYCYACQKIKQIDGPLIKRNLQVYYPDGHKAMMDLTICKECDEAKFQPINYLTKDGS